MYGKLVFSFLGSYSMFGMGHLVSRVLERVPDSWDGCSFAIYRLYSGCMSVSSDIQDWGGAGPWQAPDTAVADAIRKAFEGVEGETAEEAFESARRT